jgi:hypothetical protein
MMMSGAITVRVGSAVVKVSAGNDIARSAGTDIPIDVTASVVASHVKEPVIDWLCASVTPTKLYVITVSAFRFGAQPSIAITPVYR